MEYPSLTKCFLDAVDRHANPRAQMHKESGQWKSTSAGEMLRRVAGLSKVLARLGVQAGDRVALLAPNCPEWHVADFAILGLGAVTVPIYFNDSLDRLTYIVNESGARILIAVGEAQGRKIAECKNRIPGIEHVISTTPLAGPSGDTLLYGTLIHAAGGAEITEYRRRAAEVAGGQLATIIYTSGTTGEPKGVMLSHANLVSNALDALKCYDLPPTEVALSFLPLAHVFERIAGYAFLFRGVSVAYVDQGEKVAKSFAEVRPTIATAVPRFFEGVYGSILEKGRRGAGWKRAIFNWALRVAEKAVPWRAYDRKASIGVRFQWHIADALVYARIRAGLGGRIRAFISGGGPLAPELGAFFWSLGMPVYEGYGLTETSPVVSVNYPGKNRLGTVGQPIRNVEVRIAADGEILVKGPCVMQGYYRKPADTREMFTADGWLLTGDIGRIDEAGHIVITDRKKEFLKTAAGKLIAPAPIENSLRTSPFISNAIIVGDRRKFLSALIVPNFPAVEAEAQKCGREIPARTQIIADPWARGIFQQEIKRLTSSFAQIERPKRFALIEEDFSFEKGELTYTLKLKRRTIEQHYRDVIARLYSDVEDPRPRSVAEI